MQKKHRAWKSVWQPVFRIWDTYPRPGVRSFPSRIPNEKGTRSRIRIRNKDFIILNPNICYQVLGNMIRNVYCGSRVHSSSRIQGQLKHRIPDLDPQHCWQPSTCCSALSCPLRPPWGWSGSLPPCTCSFAPPVSVCRREPCSTASQKISDSDLRLDKKTRFQATCRQINGKSLTFYGLRYNSMNIFKKGIGSYLNNCFQSVFRIPIDSNADPDPAFYLNADANLDLGSKNRCGSVGTKAILKDWKSGLFADCAWSGSTRAKQ